MCLLIKIRRYSYNDLLYQDLLVGRISVCACVCKTGNCKIILKNGIQKIKSFGMRSLASDLLSTRLFVQAIDILAILDNFQKDRQVGSAVGLTCCAQA